MVNLEGKFKEVTEEDNYMSFFFNTNYFDAIHLSRKDRRFAVFASSPVYVGNFDYFARLRDKCFNQECGDILYSFLRSDRFKSFTMTLAGVEFKNVNFDEVNLKKVPMTQVRRTMIEASMTSTEIYLENLERGEITLYPGQYHTDPTRPDEVFFVAVNLHESYCNRLNKLHQSAVGLKKFMVLFDKHFGDASMVDRITRAGERIRGRWLNAKASRKLHLTTMKRSDPQGAELDISMFYPPGSLAGLGERGGAATSGT